MVSESTASRCLQAEDQPLATWAYPVVRWARAGLLVGPQLFTRDRLHGGTQVGEARTDPVRPARGCTERHLDTDDRTRTAARPSSRTTASTS